MSDKINKLTRLSHVPTYLGLGAITGASLIAAPPLTAGNTWQTIAGVYFFFTGLGLYRAAQRSAPAGAPLVLKQLYNSAREICRNTFWGGVAVGASFSSVALSNQPRVITAVFLICAAILLDDIRRDYKKLPYVEAEILEHRKNWENGRNKPHRGREPN